MKVPVPHLISGKPAPPRAEVEQRWIAGTNWSYEATINVNERLAAAANVDLVLPGVDTAANVTLNGILVGSVSNMHRTFRLAVKPALFLRSPAILRFDLSNPLSFSAAFLASCRAGGGPYCPDPWSGPAPNPIVNNAYIRKEQDSFSWDFAPATGTTGVWKEPMIVGYSGAVLAATATAGSIASTGPAQAARTGGRPQQGRTLGQRGAPHACAAAPCLRPRVRYKQAERQEIALCRVEVGTPGCAGSSAE